MQKFEELLNQLLEKTKALTDQGWTLDVAAREAVYTHFQGQIVEEQIKYFQDRIIYRLDPPGVTPSSDH